MPYAQDLKAGDTYDLGRHTVDQDEIRGFAESWDPQPFHLGGDTTTFDGIIASGWHTASIFMRLYVDGFLADGTGRSSPGLDELRWSEPVRPGDVLTARLTVERVMPSLGHRDRSVVAQRCEMTNDRGEPVLTMCLHTLFQKRPQAADQDGAAR